MKARKRSVDWKAKILFFVPFLLLLGVVTYNIVNYAVTPRTGTLQVSAIAQLYHDGTLPENIPVSVDGTAVTTPGQVVLNTGSHIVSFPGVEGYYTPSFQSVTILPAKTSFVTAIYRPVPKLIISTNTGFNATKVSAIHDVTPVVFVNTSPDIVTIQGTPWTSAAINPGGNFTFVYQSSGTFFYYLLGNPNVGGQVSVK